MEAERIVSIDFSDSSAPATLDQLRLVSAADPALRFRLELEFVELLANPAYLAHLADQRFLDHPSFVAYVDYLQYWRTPEYIVFITYPHALLFLELLQHGAFRRRLADVSFSRFLADSQFWHSKVSTTLFAAFRGPNGALIPVCMCARSGSVTIARWSVKRPIAMSIGCWPRRMRRCWKRMRPAPRVRLPKW